jgi:hypothetical protein
MNIPSQPTTPKAFLLTRSYWKSVKDANVVDAWRKAHKIKTKHDIGPKFDALEKAYQTAFVSQWKEFPINPEDKEWEKKVRSVGKTRVKYIEPLYACIDALEEALDNEAEETPVDFFRSKIKQIKICLGRLRKETDGFYDKLKAECENELRRLTNGLSSDDERKEILGSFRRDFAKELAAKFKGSPFSYTCPCIEVSYSIIDLGGKQNAFVIQIFNDGLNKVFDTALAEAARLFDDTEKIIMTEIPKLTTKKMVDNRIAELQKKLYSGLESIVMGLKSELEQEVQASYVRISKRKTEYKLYKKAAKIKVAKGSLSVVASAIGTIGSAGAVAGGATVAAGIAGLVVSARSLFKSCMELGKMFKTLAADATSMGKNVQADVRKLQIEFKKKPENNAYLNFTKDVLNEITDFAFSVSFNTTVKTVSTDFETWRQKTNGLFEGARKAAKPIIKHLDMALKLEKAIENKLDPGKNPKAIALKDKTVKELLNLRNKIQALIDKVSEMGHEFNKNLDALERCGPPIAKLQKLVDAKVPPQWNTILQVVRIGADIIDSTATAVLGNIAFPDAKIIPELMGTITDCEDGLNTLDSLRSSIKEVFEP